LRKLADYFMNRVPEQLPKVGIVIINYNGASMVSHCLDQLKELIYPNKEIVFLDNASTDDSTEIVKNKFPGVKIHQTGHNAGYSGGAEIAVNMAKRNKWDYLMLMNPDIIFEPDYLQVLLQKLEANSKIGAIIGKLYKYHFAEQEKTNIIDSAGILAYRDRRFVDRGQAQEDKGQFDQEEEVFGITGAAPLYRVEALKDIEVLGEVFDQDFFMYKEDVDVSWRLQLFGWQCWYIPEAIAHHGRGTGVYKRDKYKDVANERQKLSSFQKTHSFRNQHCMQLKNELWGNFWHDYFPIVGKELLFFGYMTLREPYLYKSLWQFLRLIPKMRKKRRAIMKRKTATANQMQRWFK